MKKKFERSYGLVFEGGGAKGAYEIGVWKALKELNIKVDAVVGTSIGALNGALFAQGDFEKAINIWENICYSTVINVEDDLIEKIADFKWSELSLHESTQQFLEIIRNRGLDITPLKALIDEMVNEELLRKSEIDFGLVTFNLTNFKPLELMIGDIEPGKVAGYLLASAYLPSFKMEKIFGKRFLDGGFYNVAPTSMLVEQGYKNIIEVRIQGIGLEKKYDDSNLNLIQIVANEDLGGILELNQVKAKKNIKLGYYDTLRAFHAYDGNRYYIKTSHKEAFFLKQFIMMKRANLELVMISLGNRSSIKLYGSKQRLICEEFVPLVVKKLKLTKKASYKDIYLSILENMAEVLKVERFNIYTLESFLDEIRKKWDDLELVEQEELIRNDILIELVIALGV